MMDPISPQTAVIVIDHGSRFAAANEMLDAVVRMYHTEAGVSIVEPAHMELASPTLEEAVLRCVDRGATTIVVHPYFLAPGRHSTSDIPEMVAALAPRFLEIEFRVTDPLGVDSAMAALMHRRVLEALARE